MDCRNHVLLPLRLEAPALARRHMHQIGRSWSADLLADAVLATSELVANAVQHAAGTLTLVVQIAAGTVRVEVHDGGNPIIRQGPRDGGPQRVALEDERGRGLSIVAAVADRWGVIDSEPPPGKSIWFKLDRFSARRAAEASAEVTAEAPLRDAS